MIEVLKLLTTLQQIDHELAMLNFKNQEIPKKIEGMKLAINSVRDDLETGKRQLQEFKKQYKLAELEQKAVDEKIVQYSVQLYQAKTNEQYKAFLKEIDAQKAAKVKIEDQMIENMEQSEAIEKKIQMLAKELAEVESETQSKISVLEQEAKEILQAIKTRQEERRRIVENLSKDIIGVYERIKKGKGGLALAIVEDERCTGCLNPIPPQIVLEIKKGERLYFCDYCGRILACPTT